MIEFLQTGTPSPDPALVDQYRIVREHYIDMLEHYGRESGLRMARKHIGWYTKGLPKSAEFRARINSVGDADAAIAAIDRYYGEVLERAEAA